MFESINSVSRYDMVRQTVPRRQTEKELTTLDMPVHEKCLVEHNAKKIDCVRELEAVCQPP